MDAAAEKASYIRHRRMRLSQLQRLGCGGPHWGDWEPMISPWQGGSPHESEAWVKKTMDPTLSGLMIGYWSNTFRLLELEVLQNVLHPFKVWIKQIDQTKHLSDISNQWWLMVMSFINSPGSLWFNDFLPVEGLQASASRVQACSACSPGHPWCWKMGGFHSIQDPAKPSWFTRFYKYSQCWFTTIIIRDDLDDLL